MAVARALGAVDIVSVDAFQVYRGMDIGTAKPTAADRVEVPHHGLDLADPADEVTVVDYLRAYDEARSSIAARQRSEARWAGPFVLQTRGTGRGRVGAHLPCSDESAARAATSLHGRIDPDRLQ